MQKTGDVFIYMSNDYRQIIRAWVEREKQAHTGMTYERLAGTARVPKSYLSRVMRGSADLSVKGVARDLLGLAQNQRVS